MATDVCSAGQGAKQCVPISCATGAVVTLCNNVRILLLALISSHMCQYKDVLTLYLQDPNRPYLVPSACGDVSDIVGRIIAQCGNSGTWTDLDQQFTISVAANNCGSAFTSW